MRRYQAHASYFDDMDISLGDFVQMDEETQGFHEKSAAKLASEGGV